ncbi:hypothetical protein [Idiomarina sp. ST10R2A5]|uniref:hypothetical protein n=1 Tax=Idiomarina sp. ST10R2A5 TaxID=3418368 RepID=UPI003F6DC8F5
MAERGKGGVRQGLVSGVVVLLCQGVEGHGWPSSSPHGSARSVPDIAKLQQPTGSCLIPPFFLIKQTQKTRREGRVLF